MVENEERWPSNFRAGENLVQIATPFIYRASTINLKSVVGFPIHAIFFQVMESLALADLKKRNAAKLDAKNQEQLLEMGREVPGEIKPQEGKNYELNVLKKVPTPNILNHVMKQDSKWNLNWTNSWPNYE